MSSEVIGLVERWTASVAATPLPPTAVPGTSDDERRTLAALGGLAGMLAGDRVVAWPEPIRSWAAGEPAPDWLVDEVRRGLEADSSLLGWIYERLVAGRNRRRLGTFFTPPDVVDFMLSRAEAIGGIPAVVIDPGAGVGAFSLAAKKRWPSARVIAVDINLVTLGLLAAGQDAGLELVLDDFLTYSRILQADGPRLWIGNPPYTRHHDLAAELKREAREDFPDLIWSRRAGLSAYFLAATLLSRNAPDTIAYLLPGTWIDTAYGEPLRRAVMTTGAGSVEMHGFETNVDLFPGTRVAAMALVVGPDGSQGQLVAGTARRTTAGVVTTARTTHPPEPGHALGIHVWPRQRPRQPDSVELASLGRVRRGTATGANHYFFLNNKEAQPFPREILRRAIPRLRAIGSTALTVSEHDRLLDRGERGWLLYISAEDQHNPSVATWIAGAEEAGVHLRYLCSHRKPWYQLERVAPPDILISPMTNGRFRVVANSVRAIPSNALYGVYLHSGDLTDPLVAWLNGPVGQKAMAAASRTYGSRLLKMEPSDLASLPVPSPEALAESIDPPARAPDADNEPMQAVS